MILRLERCLDWAFLFVTGDYEIYFIFFYYAQSLSFRLTHRFVVPLNWVNRYLLVVTILSLSYADLFLGLDFLS